MNTPIFCINLERAIERKNKIKRLWIDNLHIDITFWKAWDRKDIEKNILYFKYDPELTQKTLKRQLSSGEIACVTSHCMVYEYALNNNLEYCIVMEDDILPTKFTESIKKEGFDKILSEVLMEMKDTKIDIVLLFDTYDKLKNEVLIKTTKNLVSYAKLPWGNQMILLNRSGIKKMYDNLKALNYVADHWNIFPFSNPERDIAIIKTPLGRHEYGSSSDATTYIGQNNRNSSYYSNFIDN